MKKYLRRAQELRKSKERHYNCAQATFIPFAEEFGLDEDAAYGITLNFGSGMKIAGTCGAITGGLMVLGLYGVDDPLTIAGYYQRFKDGHDGYIDCAGLLKSSREKGIKRGPHCDGLVYEAVETVYGILKEKGLV